MRLLVGARSGRRLITDVNQLLSMWQRAIGTGYLAR